MKTAFQKLIISILLGSFSLSGLAKQPVTIGFDDDYPPFAYLDSAGQPAGVYTEILKTAFAKLEGYDVTVTAFPWKRLMKMVETGAILGAYPPYYWPEKRPWMAPYSEPILTERVVLYCNSTRVDKETLSRNPEWPSSFHGLVIGNDTGFQTPGQAFFDAVDEGKISVHEGSTKQNVKLLLLGRIDCYINGELSIQHMIKKFVDYGDFVDESGKIYKALTIRENQGYVGYAQDAEAFPFKGDFVEQVDVILREMKASGEIERILDRYRVQ